jgi:hypothetical protein
MVILDAFQQLPRAPRPRQRLRRDWVRGDVRCLMCGRLLGRLLGITRLCENGDHSAGQPIAFIAYRPLNPVDRIVPFSPEIRFRCNTCGGTGALDEIEVFSTYDEPPTAEREDETITRGRGRPMRPFPPQSVNGVQAALSRL